MKRLTLGKMIGLAILSAMIGSCVGTGVLAISELRVFHPNRFGPLPPLSSAISAYFSISFISLIGTIPGALIVGMPAIYPFRMAIVRRPFLLLLPVILTALILSFVMFGWDFKSRSGSGYQNLNILFGYAGGTAFGFICSLGWWGRRRIEDLDT